MGLRVELPIWYFQTKIIDGYQIETPDYWLNYSNPWVIDRNEIQIPVDFYGYVYEEHDPNTGKVKKNWNGGERVLAVLPISQFLGLTLPTPTTCVYGMLNQLLNLISASSMPVITNNQLLLNKELNQSLQCCIQMTILKKVRN